MEKKKLRLYSVVRIGPDSNIIYLCMKFTFVYGIKQLTIGFTHFSI
jgi:hypothetical protein